MTNTFTKTYQDDLALTEAELDTAYQTVKPSLSNMALMTTGSASGDILTSVGSASAPLWKSFVELVATASAADANAFFAKVTVVAPTQANLILASVTSVSSTQANLISNAITAVSSTQANLVAAAMDVSNFTTGTVPTARLPAASTAASGVVRLIDSFNSALTDRAPTANALDMAYDDLNENKAGFSTSSSSGNTSLPVGSYVMTEDSGGPPNRNQTVTVHLGLSDATIYSYNSGGSQLTGTWRAAGNTSGATLFRRTA